MSAPLDATSRALLDLGAPDRHPAGAVLGVRTGAGTSAAAAGWAVLPRPGTPGVAMTTGTVLDLASVTKAAATTTLAMLLVAEGRLELDAPARTYLPDLTGPGTASVTVEHLFTHTAGLPAWRPLYVETSDRDEALRLAQQTAVTSEPGTSWCYSDLGLILAGHLVERVIGLDLRAAFTTHVAEPLGLGLGYGPVDPDTAAVGDDSDAYELAMVATGTPYPVDADAAAFDGWRAGPLHGEADDGNAALALGGIAGHAGLFGTVPDLLALGDALHGGFVPEQVLRRFATPCAAHPAQAVGFRRRTLTTDRGPVELLWHPGFTGTLWALAAPGSGGVELADLVVAGAATRLHGTIGPLPATRPRPGDPLPAVVGGDQIHALILDGVRRLLSTPMTSEDR